MAKLTAVQKLALGYYKTKLNLINSLSTRWAAAEAFDVFTKPYPVKPKPDPPIWATAQKLFVETPFGRLAGYSWQPAKPNGQKFLIVHGFAGNTRSFQAYIKPLLSKGYEVFAYDAPAHGKSGGKRLNASMYMQVLEIIVAHHGGFHAYLGHSLGGLAIMLALHHHQQPMIPKIVLIAPATESTTAADNFFDFLRLPAKLRKAFEMRVEKIGGVPLQWYSIGRVLHEVKGDILWLHDEEDFVTPIGDVYPLMDPHPKHVHFHFTKGLGHSRIYHDSKIKKLILNFVG